MITVIAKIINSLFLRGFNVCLSDVETFVSGVLWLLLVAVILFILGLVFVIFVD